MFRLSKVSLLTAIRRITFLSVGLVTLLTGFYAPPAGAVSQNDLNSIIGNTSYYDSTSCSPDESNTSAGSSGSSATSSVAAFVDKYGDVAYNNSITSGVPYEFTLGQAIIESGYGGSELSAKYNNFFGIKATSDWKGATVTFPTHEYVRGISITIDAKFRAYPTPQAGFADHDQFLRENSRYAAAFQHSNDPIAFLNAVAAAGYATSPTYAHDVGVVVQEVQSYISQSGKWPPSSAVKYNITPLQGDNGSTGTDTVTATCNCNSASSSPQTTLDTSLVPAPYADIFSKAGAKYGVAPAFIAAIFYGGENGHSWPTPPPPYGTGREWPSSKTGAKGPFQFEPGTWKQYGVDGNGDGKADVEDLTDASFGAAHYFAAALHAANTTDEQTLRQAASDYNGTHNPGSEYATSVWEAFQKFNGQNTSVSAPGSTSTSECPASGGTSSISGYQDPYRDIKGLQGDRIDEGVDYGGSGPIYALGAGKVVLVRKTSGWPGTKTTAGSFVTYQLGDGPAAGKYVYVAENCTPSVSLGETVTTSTVICQLHDAWAYSESGWAVPPSQGDLAAAHAIYTPDGIATAYGNNFNDLLQKLGTKKSGVYQFSFQRGGKDLKGSLPSGWPTW